MGRSGQDGSDSPQPPASRTLYQTVDGGLHWKLVGHSGYDAAGQFDFISATTAFIPAGDEIVSTHNGGRSWAAIKPTLATV